MNRMGHGGGGHRGGQMGGWPNRPDADFGGGQQKTQSRGGLLGGIVGSAILPVYLVLVFGYLLYIFFKARNKESESSKTSARKKEIDDLKSRLDRTEKALNKLVQATEKLQKAVPEEEMKKILEDFCEENKHAVEDISVIESASVEPSSEEVSSSANDDATASDEISESLDADESISQSISSPVSAPTTTESSSQQELTEETNSDDDSEQISEPEKISDESIDEFSQEKLSEDEVQVINIDDKNDDELSENPNLRQRTVNATESADE